MSSIQEFIAARGIKYLYHFTKLANLDSILKHGLHTRDMCTSLSLNPAINDAYRYDGTHAVCATIGFPNYRMFFPLRTNPVVKEHWVVLELDAALLWVTDCLFCTSNAATGTVSCIPHPQRRGLAALQAMFGDYGTTLRASLNLPDHYTTNPQAEVLLMQGANAASIKKVYFEYHSDLLTYQAKYPQLPTQLNGGMFDGRFDHAHWKNNG
jgi:hypothetical protein